MWYYDDSGSGILTQDHRILEGLREATLDMQVIASSLADFRELYHMNLFTINIEHRTHFNSQKCVMT